MPELPEVETTIRGLNILINKKVIKIITKTKKLRYNIPSNISYKFKDQNSIALMVDQRVSEGISVNLFDKPALTTTIPAQMVLRYNCKIVPVEIKRINNINFEIKINNPVSFEKKDNKIDEITLKINQILEKMILANPKQWIWPHNRWK